MACKMCHKPHTTTCAKCKCGLCDGCEKSHVMACPFDEAHMIGAEGHCPGCGNSDPAHLCPVSPPRQTKKIVWVRL